MGSAFMFNAAMQAYTLTDARAYALDKHGLQMYGPHPYVYHLDAVAAELSPFGMEAQAIGYLHDVVEDTDATMDEIQARFGAEVAACVALLTDQPGSNRQERKAKTYAKLAKVNGTDELALVVKVADRLSNVRECVAGANLRLWRVYRDEQAVFKTSAFRKGLCDALWLALEALLTDDMEPTAA